MDIHVPPRVDCHDFGGDPQTFHLTPLSGQTFNLSDPLVFEIPNKLMTFPSAFALLCV